MAMNNAITIEVDGHSSVNSLVFLEDGKHFLSGSDDGMIRQWRVEDGMEVEDMRLAVSNGVRVEAIALSGDGNWVIGTGLQVATVWNRRTRQIVLTVREHSDWVFTAHVSPDSTKFATGSKDKAMFICDMLTGRRLIGPLKHDNTVSSVRFSPDGDCVAAAVRGSALRIYNAQTGQLLRDIVMDLFPSDPIAWSSDSQYIFALSSKNAINHLHVGTGTILSHWTIPGQTNAGWTSIVLPSNGKFIASFTNRSLTFWDASTHAQFGPVFDHTQALYSVSLSSDNNYLVTGSNEGIITLRNLNDIIPMSYLIGRNVFGNGVDLERQIKALRDELRLLTSRVDELSKINHSQAPCNGAYRIKNNTGDLYLTRPQDGTGTVFVQSLNLSNVCQIWSVSHVIDGTHLITDDSGVLLSVIGDGLFVGDKGNIWAFEPRGNACVIGNAVNATAIQLAPNRQSVSVLPRNNSQNQRWVLERVMQ